MNRIVKVPMEAKYDARLLTWGVFDPLDGFMTQAQWEQACVSGVVDGEVVGLPMALPISEEDARSLVTGEMVDLVDPAGMAFATLEVGGVFKVDERFERAHSLGTEDASHPWAARLGAWGPWRAHGRLSRFRGDLGADPFKRWLSPQDAIARAKDAGWKGCVALQSRNPLHGAHLDLVRRALELEGIDGALLHPAMGVTRPGDLLPQQRARCYEAALASLPEGRAMLGYAPLAMRMAGPREALWHARIRKAFGATAFIVGRDHAGPGADSHGRPFYDPVASAELAKRHEGALGVRILAYEESVYEPRRARFVQPHELAPGDQPLSLSGTGMRAMLARGESLPAWFTPPAVAQALLPSGPPGVGVLLTGLSAAGKSALAQRLAQRWSMVHGKPMTVLDGDEARKMLSSELGFSREHRDLNVARLGYVAAEVAKHGGACVISAIAPFESARQTALGLISKEGIACLAHVATSLHVCESRDPKGLYARARSGDLRGFTGIDDPYEEPERPDLRLDLGILGLDEACEAIEAWISAKARACAPQLP